MHDLAVRVADNVTAWDFLGRVAENGGACDVPAQCPRCRKVDERRQSMHDVSSWAFCEFNMVKTRQNHLCVVRVSPEIGDNGS
jgi:hypothetical protein